MKSSTNNIKKCPLTNKLNENLTGLQDIFNYPTNSDFRIRELHIKSVDKEAILIYLQGMIDTFALERNVIRTLIEHEAVQSSSEDIATTLMKRVITGKQVKKISTLKEAVDEILSGYAVLIIDGETTALAISTIGFEKRPVEKPTIENILRGPREAFTESSIVNRSLIRKHLSDPNLITEELFAGERGAAEIYIMYVKGIVNMELVDEVKRRISKISVDNLQENAMLEQYIEDRTYSIVPSVLMTERPDRVIAFLKEGHVAIITNNGSGATVVPITFWTLFHTAEDIYLRWPFGNFIRILRMISIIIALLTPAFYIAITTFHTEMIPPDMLMAITASRERLPFPVFIEIVIMELSFELIREAGIRIPTAVGPTIGILGTLILGQAAVEANIVSPVLVIVVSITGLSSFAVPEMNLSYMVRIGRFIFLVIATAGGFFAIALALTALIAYFSTLYSFGVPFFAPLSPHFSSSGDTLARPSAWKMLLRPLHVKPKDKKRG